MGYIYAALWFITAFLLLIKFRKESIVVYVLSLYFLFLGVWWTADQVSGVDMMNGIYGWVLRCVSLAALVAVGIIYAVEKTSKLKKRAAEESQGILAHQNET